MANVVLECPSRQPIWILLSRLLCHRLEFDACVLSHSVLETFAATLDPLVDSVVAKISPHCPFPLIRPQLSLPGHLGGADLLPAFDAILCAPFASLLQFFPIVCNTLRSMQLAHAIPFIDRFAIRESAQLFHDRAADPSTILGTPIDIEADFVVSVTKAYGRLIGFCAERRLHTLLANSNPTDAARILSCGGPGNGEWLRDSVSNTTQGFIDTHFLIALRWRLGCSIIPSSVATCCHQYATAPFRACGRPFDTFGNHSVMCNIGGGPTLLLHNPIANLTCSFLQSAGFDARREISIPEYTQERTIRHHDGTTTTDTVDGVVDVLGWHMVLGEYLLDVAVRHPLAQRVAHKASTCPGHAALQGETDKHSRYPDRSGRRIVPLAIETFGRIGSEFNEWLLTLSSAARAQDRSLGLAGGRHLSKWRLQLSTAVYKGIAKTLEDSYTLCKGTGDALLHRTAVI